MSESAILGLSGIAGGLLGAFFFGGLWWTVRKGVASKRPALWFLGSVLLREGVVLAGFLLASGGRWDRMLACLLGFVLSRPVVTRLTRTTPALSRSEVRDAPHS